MRLKMTITVQLGNGQETHVYGSDLIAPDQLSSTLAIAEASVCSTLAVLAGPHVTVREYLGPALIKTIHPPTLAAS
jgi:hypothetical protein